jgi:hypothetical protein
VANASVESELRFYAVFYVAYGLVALRVARPARTVNHNREGARQRPRARRPGEGCRLAVGKPHAVQRGLLVIEWPRRRRSPPAGAYGDAGLMNGESPAAALKEGGTRRQDTRPKASHKVAVVVARQTAIALRLPCRRQVHDGCEPAPAALRPY